MGGMEGKAGVLDSEIKLDKVKGNDTQAMEEELAEVEQKAQAAAASQLSSLADAGRTTKEADRRTAKTPMPKVIRQFGYIVSDNIRWSFIEE